jgi:hypothetical protein
MLTDARLHFAARVFFLMPCALAANPKIDRLVPARTGTSRTWSARGIQAEIKKNSTGSTWELKTSNGRN